MSQLTQLDQGWRLCASAPGRFASPADLPSDDDATWLAVPRLGPVADVLRQLGQWSLDGPVRRFDAEDWWYRLRFDIGDLPGMELGLDGLATVAEVWLNGEPILSSSNMFMAHRVPVGQRLKPQGNELVIACRSLDQALTQRRPRPRWRAPMIENQQLRWFRSTVLGRTPGWTPPAAVVGPWRGIWLAPRPPVALAWRAWQNTVEQAEGTSAACADFGCRFALADGIALQGVRLQLSRKGQDWVTEMALSPDEAEPAWRAALRIEDADLWWPHTHGEPALYTAQLQVRIKGQPDALSLPLGEVGFRTVHVDRSDDGFAVHLNGVRVFCRGACWTPLDIVTLDGPDAQAYADAIGQVREAGMNMVRLGGTMHYEADAFHDECDRQGVMVWQELMFANMDYPETPEFVASVLAEVAQQHQRWQGRPSVTVLCGNSEVEQQAAMFGATRDRWAPALFHETLAQACKQALPDVPYWPSSAHGGAFPHQGDVGTTSYYGVGAYMRPLDDARRANLKFATETLAFANIPEPAGMARLPGGLGLRVHHPGWKARTPRDLGAGWDFEDVRDHYVAQLFGTDPTRLRYSDHERYLTLGRVAVGEVMAATFAEWRRAASPCGGALVWFLRDLWPGAGWGIVDSAGQPKSAYYGLKRALQPLAMAFSDEGGNGLYVHVNNDGARPLQAEIEVTAWRHGHTQVGQGRQAIELPAHGARSWPLMAWFDWFADWSYAYRFGPVSAQVLSAVLRDTEGRELARAFAFPTGHALPMERDVGLNATATPVAPGVFTVRIGAGHFAQAVHLDVDGFVPDDAYFHLAPGQFHTVTLRAVPSKLAEPGHLPSGCVRALNLDGTVNIRMEGQTP